MNRKGIVIFPVTQYITLSIYSPHKELPCCGNYHCCFHYVKIVRIGVFRACIFPYMDSILRDTPYLYIFNPNTGKYGPEKLNTGTFYAVFPTDPPASKVYP